MKRIIVVTTTLNCGGITSFLIPLVNFLSAEGHKVTLAYTKDNGNFLYRLCSEVNTLKYNTLNRRQEIKAWCKNLAFYDMARIIFRKNTQVPHYASIQRLSYITAKYINITDKNYDIAISTAEGFCNAIVANKINATKKIGWVHPDMATLGLDLNVGQKVLKEFNYMVSVSEAGCNTLKKFFPNDQQKFLYIENIIDSESIKARSLESINDMPYYENLLNIVTVCRITNDSKRLDRIVKIATILRTKKFMFQWYIIGDGPDTKLIKNLIKKYNLQDKVIMLGGRKNPMPYIKRADYFVLTSQFEGKPLVVEEAKILHTPVIVTEYSSAKMQVTKDVGIVVPNTDGYLETEIVKVLTDNMQLKTLKNSCMSYKYDNKPSTNLIKAIIK